AQLVQQIVQALKNPEAQRALAVREQLEPVGGAVPLDSKFWIVRPVEGEFREAIARRDSIVLVKGARQMGKTSILARGLQQARQAGSRCIHIDFQKLNAGHLETIESFYMALGGLMADQLDLEVMPEEVWNPRRGANVNFERYVRRQMLENLGQPLVWAMDEVDRLFTCDFGSEVFGLFRSWHNERSLDPDGPWSRLTLAIAYATEAHLFITDMNQSPFNIGTQLPLDDFTLSQVADLNARYASPLKDEEQISRFYRLVGGQPYLVQKGLNEMAGHGVDIQAFEEQAGRDEGLFGDHLRRYLVLLVRDPDLCNVLRGALKGQACPTAESFYRLRSAGLLAGHSQLDARLRCQIYENYLRRHLL
ncbi:MAG TPA: AAA-like domain-containing protein, partial [Chthonomonadaceae bacterium]|nr:AAA-like domain-containing protein [Chthonomonadaceae bacterium]